MIFDTSARILIKQMIFFGSPLMLIVLTALIIYKIRRFKRFGFGAAFYAILLILFIDARYIEPKRLVVKETLLSNMKINANWVLISDLHIGLYKDPEFLAQAVEKINQLDAQKVLIAGDFTYEVSSEDLSRLFAPLAQLKAPVFAVLGNHDQEKPGPNIDLALRATLKSLGVRVIEGEMVDLDTHQIAGLGDRWAGNDDGSFLQNASKPLFVLAHNPDSAMNLSPKKVQLVLAGHTHCGQVRLPWLYRFAIPSQFGFDCGLESAKTANGELPVFISPGLGEIGLPLRFLNPPTIDLLHLRD